MTILRDVPPNVTPEVKMKRNMGTILLAAKEWLLKTGRDSPATLYFEYSFEEELKPLAVQRLMDMNKGLVVQLVAGKTAARPVDAIYMSCHAYMKKMDKEEYASYDGRGVSKMEGNEERIICTAKLKDGSHWMAHMSIKRGDNEVVCTWEEENPITETKDRFLDVATFRGVDEV